MSAGRSRHDEHDGRHDDHNELGQRLFKMRLPSPLPAATERVMTRVIDCAMEVHKALGPGFLESIYQKAMCVEMSNVGLAFECEAPIHVMYAGVALTGQRVDLVVCGLVVVELKSVTRLEPIHEVRSCRTCGR